MEIKSNEIKMVAVESIVANPKNTNKHPPEQIDRLIKILNYQGFREPLVISNRSGFLVCGHGRLEAALKMGVKELPVIYQDFETEAMEYAHMVADNEIARWAELDKEKLKNELPDLDLDLDLLGLSDTKFLQEVGVNKIDEKKQDDIPDMPTTPVTKKGDVWLLGRHRVMCGDSLLIDDIEKLLPEKRADKTIHCLTDPPYGIKYEAKSGIEMIKNDDVFLDFLPVVSQLCNGYIFMWTSYQVVDHWFTQMKTNFSKVTNLIIWWKGGGGMGDCHKNLATDYEIGLQTETDEFDCGLVYNNGCKLNKGAKRIGSVWQIPREIIAKNTRLHPNVKPVAVNEKVLEHYTVEGDIVLDLFLGSGSNLIACEKMGRTMRGMELDEKYCDLICSRWLELTGSDPVLESTGEKFSTLKTRS